MKRARRTGYSIEHVARQLTICEAARSSSIGPRNSFPSVIIHVYAVLKFACYGSQNSLLIYLYIPIIFAHVFYIMLFQIVNATVIALYMIYSNFHSRSPC